MAEPSVLRVGLIHTYQLLRVHWVPFSAAVVLAIVFAAATVAATEVLGLVVDRLVQPSFAADAVRGDHLLLAVVAVIAVAVIRSSAVLGRRYLASMTTERARRRLRLLLGGQYLTQPMVWYRDKPTGQLLAHVDNDTTVATEPVSPLPFAIGVGFLGLFGVVAIIVTDWVMALLALGMFPVLVAINRWLSAVIQRPAAEVQEAVGNVASIAHESFDGSLVVKVLGLAQEEGERFGHANRDLRRKRVVFGYRLAMYDVLNDSVPQLGTLAVVIVGAIRVSHGAITAGDVVQVAALFTLLVAPMQVLGFFLSALAPAVAARHRLDAVLAGGPNLSGGGDGQGRLEGQNADEWAIFTDDAAVAPAQASADDRAADNRTADGPGDDGHGSPRPQPPDGRRSSGELMACGLGFGYGQQATLREVDLTVADGEMLALVGSTGAGKTTLMMILGGLYPPDRGWVEMGGTPLAAMGQGELVARRALVFQESFLFAGTLRRNLDPYARLSDSQLWDALHMASAEFVSDFPLQIDTVVGERGVTVSGGQRQRIALARALVHQPDVLLLDDATSAVDSVIEQQILDRIRNHNRSTTVIVAQRLSTICAADRVAYLADGRIQATGTHEELMEIAGYRALAQAYEETM